MEAFSEFLNEIYDDVFWLILLHIDYGCSDIGHHHIYQILLQVGYLHTLRFLMLLFFFSLLFNCYLRLFLFFRLDTQQSVVLITLI